MSLFAVFGLGPTEIALVAVLGLLLFGKKLPSMGSYLGQSIRSFQRGMKGIEDEVESPAAIEATNSVPRRLAAAPRFEEAAAR